jgi:glycosyltransferase involved in cell wall biosynthesis
MKIAVVNNWVPFVSGGAEHLAAALVRKLAEYGHQSMLVRLPFAWHPPEKIVEHMLACRLVKLDNVDRVIALKFPAYYVPHSSKVLWLLHQFRQAYDLWGTRYQDLPDTPEGIAARAAVISADNAFLPECRVIYANSPVTADRLRRFNGLAAEVLFPPLADAAHFHSGEPGDYVFCPGRITAGKRQHLLAEAMRWVRTPVRLVIAGAPETAADLERVEAVIRAHGLEDRVRLMPGFLPEPEKVDMLAGALACVYAPYDEDSYGYVTLEACHARKPTLTLEDSGGIHILVEDGVTGYIRPPEPRAIAEALDRFYDERARTRAMGEAAHARMLELKITWEHVIARLTG